MPVVTAERATSAVAAVRVDAGSALVTDAGAPLFPRTAEAMANHLVDPAQLAALFDLEPLSDADKRAPRLQSFLKRNVGPTPVRISQGNVAVAHHTISKRECLQGLQGVQLQTEAQRKQCGAPNMVPVYRHGDPSKAAFCIDIFEFPNRACELPIVWSSPAQASAICALEGKRLCTQPEWTTACKADPTGGADSMYAYGDELDLHVCNTNKSRGDDKSCRARTAKTAWDTCGTDTEPSGAFPKCRSRFGVYDLHGNVAEEMTRVAADGRAVSQLKGSAFFYVDVARKPGEKQDPAKDETYPDHCGYDPRWHVEPIASAVHVNYHLGFRCCKSIAVAR